MSPGQIWGILLLPLAAAQPAPVVTTASDIRAYCAALPNNTLIIGMVTKGNTELTLQRWRPTFDAYLSASTSKYGCLTRLVPLEFDSYTTATVNKEIDFIFPNPSAFQEMQNLYSVHEFLSVKRNFGAEQELDRFGGVIVRAAGRHTDILTIADLGQHPGLTICGVDAKAFGGWQIQWYEVRWPVPASPPPGCSPSPHRVAQHLPFPVFDKQPAVCLGFVPDAQERRRHL